MINHVSLAVHDLVASAEAYERMLAPLGLARLVERSGAVSLGKRYSELWLNHRPGQIAMPPNTGAHVCLHSPDEGPCERSTQRRWLADAKTLRARAAPSSNNDVFCRLRL